MMFDIAWMICLCAVMGAVAYPLLWRKALVVWISVGTLLVFACVYLLCGNRDLWCAHFIQEARLEKARQALKQYQSVDEVITALRARLDDSKQSARGWYLLGRLYAQTGQKKLAREAFEKARILQAQ